MALTTEEKRIQGKKNRRDGAAFERKVRKDLIEKGWIVDKFTDNIDLDKQEIVQAKSNQFNSRSCGFPDFIAFKECKISGEYYFLMFIECKCNGKLSKLEKQKMEFLRKRGHKCYVAYKDDDNEKIIKYRELLEYKG